MLQVIRIFIMLRQILYSFEIKKKIDAVTLSLLCIETKLDIFRDLSSKYLSFSNVKWVTFTVHSLMTLTIPGYGSRMGFALMSQ